ncbi:MAG: hypothetical protein E6R03_12940 [Hyphomicrobiaceae bacterium]|nr:MAG: hypothetical protein E6R03_12940 [Hyphomicrobiaceae bacterium]
MSHQNPLPSKALEIYRASSPFFVTEAAEEFKKLPIPEQLELLFYMSVHQAHALQKIGAEVQMELVETGEEGIPRGN